MFTSQTLPLKGQIIKIHTRCGVVGTYQVRKNTPNGLNLLGMKGSTTLSETVVKWGDIIQIVDPQVRPTLNC